MRFIAVLMALAVVSVGGCSDAGHRPQSRSPADRFEGKLQICDWPGVPDEVWCGALEVPEDRSIEGGRTIHLRVAVLPATGDTRAATDAFTFLAGGGVVPATRYLPFFAGAVPRLREGRDIVLVDQRGTGGSNALDCDLPEPYEVEGGSDAGRRYEQAYLAALRECRERTEERADPTRYTTWNAADDLDAVREWLGYEQLSLWGASYGTKLARVYMRRHPDRVRAAALHGAVPIERSMWPDLFQAADSALTELFALCAADPACADAYPDLDSRFEGLLERLEVHAGLAARADGRLTLRYRDRAIRSALAGRARGGHAAIESRRALAAIAAVPD